MTDNTATLLLYACVCVCDDLHFHPRPRAFKWWWVTGSSEAFRVQREVLNLHLKEVKLCGVLPESQELWVMYETKTVEDVKFIHIQVPTWCPVIELTWWTGNHISLALNSVTSVSANWAVGSAWFGYSHTQRWRKRFDYSAAAGCGRI